MNWRATWCVVVAIVAGWKVASAQVVDSAAAAVGIYRAIVPSDTARPPAAPEGSVRPDTVPVVPESPMGTTQVDTAAGGYPTRPDSLSRMDSLGRVESGIVDTSPKENALQPVVDTSRKENALQPVDEPDVGDTSLTARMDVRRGGGLQRTEFPDLLSTAAMTGGYRTFLKLVDQSALRRVLADGASVTLLAPTDSAFARLPESDLARLRTEPKLREAWLGTLVLKGSLKSRDLVKAGELRSRGGTVVQFTEKDSVVRAGPARLVQPDLVARNGVLHGVDRVVLPNSTSASP